MSNAVFPDLKGLAWQVAVEDTFDTIVYKGANRWETRLSKDPNPITRYTLTYEFLRDSATHDELNTLRGFFLSRQGNYDSFLLDMSKLTRNTADATITGQVLTVDANNYAPMIRTLGASNYAQVIFALNGSPVFKGAGSVITGTTSGPSPTATYGGASYPGVVAHFGSTPTAPVTADFSWYHRVRFEAGNSEYEYFMYQLAELKQMTLISARDL